MEPIPVSPDELQLPRSMPQPKRKGWGIGMVGFGEFARRAHAPDYAAAGWTIAAVAVPSAGSQREARERFGVGRVYADYRELVEDDAVEVVDVLTQPDLREEVVAAAARAGKHVIVEKPLGRTVEECVRMVEAAEAAGVHLAVHQNYRWMKGSFFAHHIVAGGWVGSPFFAGIEKFGRQDEKAVHSFYSGCEDYLTLHWNTHLADLLRYWTGRDARRVLTRTARMKGQNYRSDNLLFSTHDFGPGLTGHIVHSELVRSSLVGDRCRVDGDAGSVVFDFAGEEILLESARLGHGVRRLDTTGMDWPDALCGSMGDLLLSIEEGREPLVSGRRNLPTVRTVFAEIESARDGGSWVDVDGREESPVDGPAGEAVSSEEPSGEVASN
jgi:predicted dehydrogenase